MDIVPPLPLITPPRLSVLFVTTVIVRLAPSESGQFNVLVVRAGLLLDR